MTIRRSRKQIDTFTHPKITGDIPVFYVKEAEGVRFEVDLTVAKLTPRIPFCRSGDSVASLIADAQTFIDTYFTLTWTKFVYFAASPVLSANGVGLTVTTGIVECTTWPAGQKQGSTDELPKLWRDAATPWETRETQLPAGFEHSHVAVLPWTPELEEAAQRLKGKVSAFAQTIIAGLASPHSMQNMLMGSQTAKG